MKDKEVRGGGVGAGEGEMGRSLRMRGRLVMKRRSKREERKGGGA